MKKISICYTSVSQTVFRETLILHELTLSVPLNNEHDCLQIHHNELV